MFLMLFWMARTVPAALRQAVRTVLHRAALRPVPVPLAPVHPAPVPVHPAPPVLGERQANSATGMAPCCRYAVTRTAAGDGRAIKAAWGRTPAIRNPARTVSSVPAVHRPVVPAIRAAVTGMAPAILSALTRNTAGAGKTIAAVFHRQPATVSNFTTNFNAGSLCRACPGFF